MTRVLIVSSEFPPGPGGIGTHAFQLASHLSHQRIEVMVLSPQDYAVDEDIVDFNARQPFTVRRMPNHNNKLTKYINRLRTFCCAMQTYNPHVVIASGQRTIWLAALVLAWGTTPWIVVGHGTDFSKHTALSAPITRITGNMADAIICVSDHTLQAAKALGLYRPAMDVIHNGADHTHFYPLPTEEISTFRRDQSADDAFVLLTVGRVSERKGQEVVIRALPKIKAHVPKVQYWMAGIPEHKTSLETLAQELGVFENIRFWGVVPKKTLLMLYNACDLFMMTSRQLPDGDFEGFGIAVIEAALCGRTAVVSDQSGLAEAVQDGRTGLLVPQNDPETTARAILKLAQDTVLCQHLAQNAFQNAHDNLTWEKVGQRYVEVLENVLSQPVKTQQ